MEWGERSKEHVQAEMKRTDNGKNGECMIGKSDPTQRCVPLTPNTLYENEKCVCMCVWVPSIHPSIRSLVHSFVRPFVEINSVEIHLTDIELIGQCQLIARADQTRDRIGCSV